MFQQLANLPPGVTGVRALGHVSRQDYETVLEPILEDAHAHGRRLRFLYELGPELDGFSAGAAWEDARMGLRFMRLFEACAVVTDLGWVRDATKLAAFVLPCPVRVFTASDRGQAVAWLASLPEGPTAKVRLVEDKSVLVFDVKDQIRVADFDALAAAADAWIEAHGELHGLVIHVRTFPGWESLSAMIRHARFIRNHHRKIGRVAFATDIKLAAIAPAVAVTFIAAKVQAFPYDALEQAVAWAGSTRA